MNFNRKVYGAAETKWYTIEYVNVTGNLTALSSTLMIDLCPLAKIAPPAQGITDITRIGTSIYVTTLRSKIKVTCPGLSNYTYGFKWYLV